MNDTRKFHVSCPPYHANFDPVLGKYFGPSHASYALVNDFGYAVAIIDYSLDKVERLLCGENVSTEDRDLFIAQAQEHFQKTPRWNA